jgi:hypothetical protein
MAWPFPIESEIRETRTTETSGDMSGQTPHSPLRRPGDSGSCGSTTTNWFHLKQNQKQKPPFSTKVLRLRNFIEAKHLPTNYPASHLSR